VIKGEGVKWLNKETTLDALKWFEVLIKHYQQNYHAGRALKGILSEVQTCIAIAEFPNNEGTRFKEAAEQLARTLR